MQSIRRAASLRDREWFKYSKMQVFLVIHMPEIVIPIPQELEKEKSEIEHKLRESVELEVKRRLLAKFFDEIMKGAKQLTEDEVVEFSRKFKKAGANELKKEGLI